jgi:hypothetical protein
MTPEQTDLLSNSQDQAEEVDSYEANSAGPQVSSFSEWKASAPKPALPMPPQSTRGAATIATEAVRVWLDTRGAATYVQAPQTPPKIIRRRPCESRHGRSRRVRPIRRRGSRRTTATTRAGPDDSGDADPDGEHLPLTVREIAGAAP